MPCEERPHPLPHDGTSQPDRALPAADAAYVRADERTVADHIVRAGRLSKHIAFFDNTNVASGDWKPFFEGGEAALLSLLAVQDVDEYRRAIAAQFTTLKSDDTSGPDLKAALGAVFSGAFSLTKALDDYRARLLPTASFRSTLDAALTAQMRPALKALLRYHKGAAAMGLLADSDLEDWTVLDAPVQSALAVIASGLSPVWTDGTTAWPAYYAALAEDRSIFGDPAWSDSRQIGQAASHNLFTGQFDRYLSAYARLAREAAAGLKKVLEGEGTHTPHYALFLTFLQLYRHAQDGFNSFGSRHLDFFYKDVLRLRKKPAVADTAHLLIELAKTATEVLLPKDTLFKDGKDSSGAEVIYGLDADTVVNRAAVASIASLYRGRAADNRPGVVNAGRMFYAPAIASADGLGAEIKTEVKDWHPYNLRGADGALLMPSAEIGFAVASHYLALAEGFRVIRLKLPTATGSPSLPATAAFDCFLTTDKGWHKVSNAKLVAAQTNEATPGACTAVQIVLEGDAPPITGWSAKVHGGAFKEGLPTVKVVLRQDGATPYTYDTLQGVALRGVEIEVRVGVAADTDALVSGGLKTLSLANDLGPLDPARPFFPFGPEPRRNSSFIVGSKEAFTKQGARIDLRVTWLDRPASFADYVHETDGTSKDILAAFFELKYLAGGQWDNPATIDASLGIPTGTSDTGDILAGLKPLPEGVTVSPDEVYGAYNTASRGGFVRLRTLVDFGHAAQRIAAALAAAAGTTPPPVPYSPKISAITLHYTAAGFLSMAGDAAAFEERPLRFFHLHPAGTAEQHAQLTGTPTMLLPQFSHGADGGAVQHTGELYIGIENLAGGQGVSLLVQLMEGTTDPLVLKPEGHVSWSYLTGNRWLEFGTGEVTDGTDGFIRSGIVTLVIPNDARTDNSLLGPGLLWIRAAIGSAPDAVARMLTIAAGAAKVSFRNQNNATDVLATPRAPGGIAKLKVPLAAVKKVVQPYASFGGRMEESETAFYPRAAERLRHRDRAISLWDYEHLVLEAFPGIHRAKCIPHTSLAGGVYRENAPGHVMLVVVPTLATTGGTPVLRPYTHEAVLEDIRDHLRPRMTGQATLHVAHPQFEEVLVKANLALHAGLEFNFYATQLREELMQFLSPWAFGNTATVEFGSRIRKSVLIDFIEERPYVNFITDVKLFHFVNGAPSADLDEVVASTARSILVSVPAEQHLFLPAAAAASGPPPPPCVDTFVASAYDGKKRDHIVRPHRPPRVDSGSTSRPTTKKKN